MKRRWLWLAPLLLVGLPVAALVLLLATEAGLRALAAGAERFAPGTLSIGRIQGSLRSPLEVSDIYYRQPGEDGAEVRLRRLHLDWQPRALLHGELRIVELWLEGLSVVPPVTEEEEKPMAWPPSPLEPPIAVVVEAFTITDIVIDRGESPLRIERVHLAARLDAKALHLERLAVTAPTFDAELKASVVPRGRYPLEAALHWSATLPEHLHLTGHGTVTGDLQHLEVRHHVAPPFAFDLEGAVRLAKATPEFDLRGTWRDLHWPPTGERVVSDEGRLQVSGALDAYRIALQAALRGQDLPATRLEATASGGAEVLTLKRLQVTSLGGMLQTAGDIRWQPQVQWDMMVHWRDLRWPPEGTLVARSPKGQLQTQGSLGAYRLALEAALDGPNIPPGHWTLAGTGDDTSLVLERLQVATLGGLMTGAGSLAWTPEVSWNLHLSGKDLNPGKQWAEWPGTLAFSMASDGALPTSGPRGTVHLETLSGRLRNQAIAGHARLAVEGEAYHLSELTLRAGSTWVEAAGGLAERWDLRAAFAAPNLADLLPDTQGKLRGRVRLQGKRQAPAIAGELAGSDLVHEDNRLRRLDVDMRVDLQDVRASRVRIEARDAVVAGQTVAALSVRGDGQIAAHVLEVALRAPEQRLKLALEGGLAEKVWRGTLRQAQIVTDRFGDWRFARPVALELGPTQARLAEACWQQASARLCAAGTWREAEGWQASARLVALPLALIQPWLPPNVTLAGSVSGEFTGQGSDDQLLGELTITPSPGTLTHRPDDEQPITVRFRDSRLRAALEPDRLTADFGLELVGQGMWRANLEVAPLMPGKELKASPLRGRLRGALTDLSLVSAFVPALEAPRGKVSVDLALAGALGAPQVIGTAAFTGGAVELPVAGIALEGVEFLAESQGGTVLDLRGQARSGPGQVNLNGKLRLDAAQGWPLTLLVQGNRFEAADLPEAHVLVSPDLQLAAQRERIELTGTVGVPEAKIAVHELPQSAVAVSGDERIEGAEGEPARSKEAIYARVAIQLGDKVTFEGFGLTAGIRGELLATEAPGKPTEGEGELRIVEGQYRAYGQQLDIKTGRLIFAGPIENPGLDVRAVRVTDEVTAGIQVSGTLKSPQLELFSEPALPQTEALSYLLLGRPLNQASSAEGNFLAQAALSAGLKGGNFLAKQLRSKLGLEELEVKSEGSLETAQLLIGKYLSPKLYVSYGAGLFGAGNTVRVRYDLFKKLSVRAEGGAQSAMDLLYSLDYD